MEYVNFNFYVWEDKRNVIADYPWLGKYNRENIGKYWFRNMQNIKKNKVRLILSLIFKKKGER